MTRLDLVLKSKLLFYFYFIECLYVGVYLIVLLTSSFPDDLPSVANLKTMAIFYKIIFLKTWWDTCNIFAWGIRSIQELKRTWQPSRDRQALGKLNPFLLMVHNWIYRLGYFRPNMKIHLDGSIFISVIIRSIFVVISFLLWNELHCEIWNRRRILSFVEYKTVKIY